MSKTIAGLIIVILGLVGVTELVTEAEVATTIDAIIQVVGIAVAWYARYQAGGINLAGKRK